MSEMIDRHDNRPKGDDGTFLTKARTILGDQGLVCDPADMRPWLTDWRGRYTGSARALALPADVEEVAALVALCAREGVPIVPQGGNTGMVGGATPDASGAAVVMSTRRMNAITIDRDAMTARCQAGAVLQELHEQAASEGLRFPLSLGAKGSATIGGLISTNAGGTQVLRHGTMRAMVAGLTVVLADGRILDLASPLKKDNRGFDLKQLFIGSEGTLGIVVSAVLDLVPAVAERRVVWAAIGSMHDARALLRHCQAAMPEALEGFEVIPDACVSAVLDYLPDARAPLGSTSPWHALLEFVADARGSEQLGERVEQTLADSLEAGLIDDAAIAASEAQADAFWQLREAIAPAEKARGPAVQHDISVPVDRMPDFVAAVEREVLASHPDHEVIAFGHLGDGNVHLHVMAPPGSDGLEWETRLGKTISARIYRMVTDWGGSISAEHGIGQDKLQILRETGDPIALDVLATVKQALDPQGTFNPGKLV